MNDVNRTVVLDRHPVLVRCALPTAYPTVLLAREEKDHPNGFANLLHAMRPLMGERD